MSGKVEIGLQAGQIEPESMASTRRTRRPAAAVMTTAALEPAGGLHEAWSFEARQALAYSVGGLGPECCMDLVQIIFGSSHKVDVLDENFTPDFASLHHDVCEQLQACRWCCFISTSCHTVWL